MSNSIHIRATAFYIQEIAADIERIGIYIREIVADSPATGIYIKATAVN